MPSATESLDCEVLIVGAGPVGLITALNLVKTGIKVLILELHDTIIKSPRAMAYGPAGVYELERTGIADECRELGMSKEDNQDYNRVTKWITIDNRTICQLESSLLGENRRPPVVCGQHLVAGVIVKHLAKYPGLAEIKFGHKVVGIEQDEQSVTAVVETKDGEKRFKAKYLVGADGARSTVRKQIGCTFDGFTYDKMVVATNVYYPFVENGFLRGQFIVHPEHFALIAKCAKDGMYRVSYGEDASLTYEQARANLENKYNAIFPGPKPVTGKYKLEMFSPYKLHQRASSKFRLGRVLLAGDAAHACNPFGGMGLTGGLCDAGGLSDSLIGVLRKGCDEDILDKYAEIRKQKFVEITDPVSRANIERLYSLNPETAAQDHDFFRQANESAEFRLKVLQGAMRLQHDFRQYWPVESEAAVASTIQA